jgi:catechol 2,3-dioxygenase-like lactoylglutathione lyase family enzyme
MEQRISLITLAVEDLLRAVQFYENMGWQAAQSGPGGGSL